MKWFIPSWNGDIRVEPEADGQETRLRVFSPTAHEVEVLAELGKRCLERGYVDSWRKRWGKEVSINIRASFTEVGAIAAELMRPGGAVITGIMFRDGKVETVEGPAPVLEQKVAEAAEEGATAAVTVKRPTPSCPACIEGSVAPASEVLLSFLSPEEHALWARTRAIVVTGGLSGHRYLLSHRHGPIARKVGRICFDLDSKRIIHCHDWSVPPEEEVLAAKLVLEHREAWLRNEATLHDLLLSQANIQKHQVFKNPFGDGLDGTEDAAFCNGIGLGLQAMLGVTPPRASDSVVPEALWR